METVTTTQLPESNQADPSIKKKKKKSRDKMAKVVKTSPAEDHCRNKLGAVFGSEYTVGQIAAIVSSRKDLPISQRSDQEKSSKLLAMFGSVGSTSGPTCVTREVFSPPASEEAKKGLEKRKKMQERQTQEIGLKKRKQQSKTTGATQESDDEILKDSENVETAKTERVPRKERPRPSLEESNRTVFVGNLPMTFDKKKLRKLFHKFGEIKSIRFRSVAPSDPDLPKRVIAHTKQFHPDRNSMNGYIVFQNEESAQKALKRNRKLVGSNHIRVDLASNSRKHDTKHSVFLGNLPFDVSDDVIREHFQECGSLENVRVIRDAKTGLGKGFGYLLFAENVSVEFALKLDGSRMAGRDIRVQRATKQKQRAVNAMKRLQGKGNIKGRGGIPSGKKPGQDKQTRGKPREFKSGQMRSKGKGQVKKGKAAAHVKKWDNKLTKKRKNSGK